MAVSYFLLTGNAQKWEFLLHAFASICICHCCSRFVGGGKCPLELSYFLGRVHTVVFKVH